MKMKMKLDYLKKIIENNKYKAYIIINNKKKN